MAAVFLSLGTNLGDRAANIGRALELLRERLGQEDALSEVINTAAVGFDGPDFLNAVVRFRTDMEPLALLRECKGVEQQMGRMDAPEYAPDGSRVFHDRIIDVDILDYEGVRMDTPEITLPHARLSQRPFFEDLLRQVRQK